MSVLPGSEIGAPPPGAVAGPAGHPEGRPTPPARRRQRPQRRGRVPAVPQQGSPGPHQLHQPVDQRHVAQQLQGAIQRRWTATPEAQQWIVQPDTDTGRRDMSAWHRRLISIRNERGKLVLH